MAFIRSLVYSGGPDAFGTQYVKQSPQQSGSLTEPPEPTTPSSSTGLSELDEETRALVAAALASRGGGGAGGGAAGVTKNRLRTSHFLRTVWWCRGEGKEVWERISARAAQMLGLPPSSAEAPQIVCYPGGLSYFRPHHDSGRLLSSSSSSPSSDPQAHDSSSSSDSSDDDDGGGGGAGNAPAGDESGDGAAWVELDRDHYGAARVATVFVYLSSHAPADGGATCFSKLAGPVRRPSLRLTVTAHRHPAIAKLTDSSHPAPPRAAVLCVSREMCVLAS
eukprot:COSAG01_NODE_3263_length_6335_cov_6.514593_3_plen_278_part_00